MPSLANARAAVSKAWPVSVRYVRRVQHLLARIIDQGSTSGEFRVDDPTVAASCIKATMMSFMHPSLASIYRSDGPDIDDVIVFCLRSLGSNFGQSSSS